MALTAVVLDVVQLPAVLVEVRPSCRRRRVHGIGEPALVPDAAGPQHGVELRLLPCVGGRIIKGSFETHAVERLLRDPGDLIGWSDSQQVVDRGRDIADVDVVVAYLAVRLDSVGPADDCGVGDTALVGGVALVQLVGRVERHRPTYGVMRVGVGAAEMVDVLDALFDGVDIAVEELHLVDRPVGPALAAGTVVGDHHDDGVVELPGLLEIVEDAADLLIGVGQEAGEHLGHPAEQALLFVVERLPRPHRVLRRPWFTIGTR